MENTLNILSVIIKVLIGLVCLTMAYKSIFAKKYLPFHQEAAGKSWEDIEESIREVILTLLRISGLGFLIVAILLIVFPVVCFRKNDLFINLAIPIISILYSSGLFLFNFILYKKTNAKTPWTGSLIVILLLLITIILSVS